ncbi:MAG TPA: transporter substrate-binding domain-containing protein [Brevibacillus sp.]|nr:transporter substrate-binding domain-containing protein [Brevibacillus sp.]
MKKAIIVMLSFLLMAVTGCSQQAGAGPEQKAPSTIQKVKDKKKLVVGTGSAYMPFEMKDKQGNFIGYDIDMMTALGKALGVEVEFKQMKFSGLIPALQTGDIDMAVSAMTIRGDRALSVSFSNPYYSTGQVFMVPKTDTTTKSWQDLDKPDKKIAVSQGTTGALLAKQIFKQAKVLDFEGVPAAAMAMNQGQADGVITEEVVVREYEQNPSFQTRGIYDLISTDNLGIAVPLNDVETVLWINSFLASYKGGLEDQASIEKWFHSSDWRSEVEKKE